MTAPKFYVPIFLCVTAFPCVAQTAPVIHQPPKITKVTVIDPDGAHITQLEVELQKAPDSMEPIAEPRQIRIDDRAPVRFVIRNLSPLDVCNRNPGAPTPTAETPVAESIVTTIAGLGGLAVGSTTKTVTLSAESKRTMAHVIELNLPPAVPAPHTASEDSEYRTLMTRAKEFFCRAQSLVGVSQYPEQCSDTFRESESQLALANRIDSAGRTLAGYAGQDFRGTAERDFFIAADPTANPPRNVPNPLLEPVRRAYTTPISSIETAGHLQAIVDEITAWAADLHKKYDYKAPSSDGGGSAATTEPPVIAGALTAAPTSLSFSPGTLTQTVKISSGGQMSNFTATPTSDGGWLKLSKAGSAAPTNGTFSDTAPTRGNYELIVSVDAGLTGIHRGSIAITGSGAATGTTNVNVKFSPSSEPSAEDLMTLAEIDQVVDRAKAEMSLLSDNNKTLETAQGTLKTAYMALLKVEDDFKRRKAQGVIQEVPITLPDRTTSYLLIQPVNPGTDRKDTATGNFACVSDIDGKTATTTNVYYSLLYQDVPHWSASAGFLTSFLGKRVIGITDQNSPPANPPVDSQIFAVTDRAQVQLVPMAFVNYRILPYWSSHYGKGKESELVWTTNLSAGFGVNPNTGTSQPEFFFGLGIGLNRLVLHPGIHVGRTENLGGGYQLNTAVPSTLAAAPLDWSYHMAFSIGFSVRVAPY